MWVACVFVFMCKFIKNRTERTFLPFVDTHAPAQTGASLFVGVLIVLIIRSFAGDVKSWIDDLRDRLDFRSQLLFDAMKIVAVFVSD